MYTHTYLCWGTRPVSHLDDVRQVPLQFLLEVLSWLAGAVENKVGEVVRRVPEGMCVRGGGGGGEREREREREGDRERERGRGSVCV